MPSTDPHSPPSKTAVLCGYYGMGNGGDEALLATLLQMLPAAIEPLVLSGNPQQTYQRYKVRAVPRKSAFQVVSALRRGDIFIWGGGSLMQDATSALSPAYYAGLMGLARQLGLQAIAWAQGIGPLERGTTRWLAKQAFQSCHGVSVRDRRSGEILDNWGVPHAIAPDPVWALEPVAPAILEILPLPRIVVALRSHPQLSARRLQILGEAVRDLQRETQAFVLLLPFQPQRDRPIAEALRSQLGENAEVVCPSDPRQLKGAFEGATLTIGMRYHSLIMAAERGNACFALSYDPKVSQLMAELDLPGWELPEMPDDPTAICAAWLACYGGGGSSGDRRAELRAAARQHQEVLERHGC